MSASEIGYTGALADVRVPKGATPGLKFGEVIHPDTGHPVQWAVLQEELKEKKRREREEEYERGNIRMREREERERREAEALEALREERLEHVASGALHARIEALEAQLAQLLEARKPTRVGCVRNAEAGDSPPSAA